MRKLVLSILVLPIAYLYLQAQTAENKTGTASISGHVILNSGPARGVNVILQTEEEWKKGGDGISAPRVSTDEKGQFRFTGLKAGPYRLSALAPGFVTSDSFDSGDTEIKISEGENLEDAEIILKPGAVITGRVTDANDRPLVEEGVSVTMLDEHGQPTGGFRGMSRNIATTDDRGIYRGYGLPAGRYLVSAGASRIDSIMLTTNRTYYPETYYPDTTDQSKAKVIKISEGNEATGIDIKVSGPKKTYLVSGRLEDANTGQPVAGVEMSFGSLTDGDKRILPLYSLGNKHQTDAQGEFRLQGILPGKYVVYISSWPGSGYYSEPEQFDVSDDDVTGLVVKLKRGGSISGVVVIEGTNDPAILSQLSQISIVANVISQELVDGSSLTKLSSDGTFVINGLRSGIAKLFVSNQFSILSVERDGTAQSAGIQINPGEQITGVRVAIGYGANSIRGQVRITNGSLPQGGMLQVSAYREGTKITNGSSSVVDPTSGRFVIQGLPTGDYELKLSLSFYAGYSADSSSGLNDLLSKQTQTVTISDDHETQVSFVVDLN